MPAPAQTSGAALPHPFPGNCLDNEDDDDDNDDKNDNDDDDVSFGLTSSSPRKLPW